MKYSLSARILHWSMAIVIIGLLGMGIYMKEFLDKEAPNRMMIYNLHKSFGVLILILILIRFLNRLKNKPPHLPYTLPKYERILAHLAHIALYIFMVIVPLSGYLMSNSFGYPAMFFGYEMPFLIAKNFDHGKVFAEIHEVAAYSLLAVVALHILGVIKHRFFDIPENDVLKRMI